MCVILWMCPTPLFPPSSRRSDAACEIKNLERTCAAHNEGNVHRSCIELELLRMDVDEGNNCSASSDNDSAGEDVPNRNNAAENPHTSEEEGNTAVHPFT